MVKVTSNNNNGKQRRDCLISMVFTTALVVTSLVATNYIAPNFVATNCYAKDFSKQGATFEIKEEGFVKMIQRKLKNMDLTAIEENMKDIARKRVEEPTPVEGITKTTKTVTHNFDPSYVLDQDVYLPSGKLLYTAGTRVNPLDHMAWDDKLIFIDSRDKEQVAWIKQHYINQRQKDGMSQKLDDGVEQNSDATRDTAKIVLVAGRPLELERETGAIVYFDQFGELTKKFNINHVPAVVEQEGKYLKVTEVDIETNNVK